MASYEDEFEYDDDSTGTDLVKNLRKQLAAAQKQLREQESLIAEWSQFSHEQTISQTLSEWGLNPKIARFIPDDVETEDDLAVWLDEFGDVFGVQQDSDEEDPSEQAQYLMQEMEDGAFDPEVSYDLVTQMEAAASPEELLRIARGLA
jgi:hypothetical protein